MTAAERERPETPAPAGAERSGLGDSPEALSASYPLHEPLQLSHRLLVSTHEASNREADRLAVQLRTVTLWSSWAGAAAVGLLAVQVSLPFLTGAISPGLASALRIMEGAAAVAALGALAWGAVASTSGKSVLERHRAERCRLLKFRFLIDPNLWTRRGNEARECRERFESDAREIQALTAERLGEWASKDTVAFAPTLPVGSGIDPHTVHTLVDYYQERRLNPELDSLGSAIGRAPARDGLRRLSSALFFTAVALVAVRIVLELPFLDLAGAPAHRTLWSALAGLVAIVLPAVAMALRLSRGGTGFQAERSRLAGMHHALSELSSRLQKASGAEAIFRELGFCEDVLESHHREWLRTMLEAG